MGPHEISRRKLLAAAGATGASSAAVAFGGRSAFGKAISKAQPATSESNSKSNIIDCHGEHQAGITTPPQQQLQIAALDVTAASRAELRELLQIWQHAIVRLTNGWPLQGNDVLAAAPADTGEAFGQGPERLTITVGFGPSLFDSRFGLGHKRPAALIDLPSFAGDMLDPRRSNGDISIQACADNQMVAEHAIRDLAKLARGLAKLRWVQAGFNNPPTAPSGTGRNLFGFKDGTANLDAADHERMRHNVWVANHDGPGWMVGGTYQVYRRVQLHLGAWDVSPLDEQQDVFGRFKNSGAPYGGAHEFDQVVSSNLPEHSHVRLANPRSGDASERERILRRGFSFVDGLIPGTADFNSGLTFIAYQRDPRRQFVPIQTRLATHDAMNEYAFHTASGIFAIPPGTQAGGYLASALFD